MKISDRYRVILLDMNSTFMFGEDRFGPAEDFFETYLRLGGGAMDRQDVNGVIRNCFKGMMAQSRDPSQYDNFISVEQGLSRYLGLSVASSPSSELAGWWMFLPNMRLAGFPALSRRIYVSWQSGTSWESSRISLLLRPAGCASFH